MNSSFVAAGVGGCPSHSSFDFRHVELYMLVGHPHRGFSRRIRLLIWSSRGNLVGNQISVSVSMQQLNFQEQRAFPPRLHVSGPCFPNIHGPPVLFFFHCHHTKLHFRKAAGTVESPAPEKAQIHNSHFTGLECLSLFLPLSPPLSDSES